MNRSAFTGLVVVLGLLAAMPAVAARPAVLDMLPQDAQLIVVTQPLEKINAEVVPYLRGLGVPMDAGFNVGDSMAAQIAPGITLDNSRGLAVAIIDLTQTEETAVVFLPVRNAAAAAAEMSATGMYEATGQGEVLRGPDGAFLCPAGDYLLAGGNADALALAATGHKGPRLNAQEEAIFSNSLVAVKMNLRSVMAEMAPMMQMMMSQQSEMTGMPGMGMFMEMLSERMTEFDSVALGARLGARSIVIDSQFQAVPGTLLAGSLAAQPTAGIDALNAVPDAPLISAMVFSSDPATFRPLVEAMLDAMISGGKAGTTLSSDEISALKHSALSMMELGAKGSYAEYVAPMSSQGTPGPRRLMGVYEFSSSADYLAQLDAAAPAFNRLMENAFGISSEYRPDVDSIDGRKVMEWRMNMAGLATAPEVRQALASQFGPDLTMVQRMTALDSRRIGYGVGEGALQSLVNHVQGGGAGLGGNPMLQAAAADLPRNANLYGFMHLGNAIRQMMMQPNTPPQAMMMAGMFMQMQSVVGGSATFTDGGLQASAAIPNEIIQYAANMAMMFTQMGPGMGGFGM